MLSDKCSLYENITDFPVFYLVLHCTGSHQLQRTADVQKKTIKAKSRKINRVMVELLSVENGFGTKKNNLYRKNTRKNILNKQYFF